MEGGRRRELHVTLTNLEGSSVGVRVTALGDGSPLRDAGVAVGDAILAIEPLNQVDVMKPIPKEGWCSKELKHSWHCITDFVLNQSTADAAGFCTFVHCRCGVLV